MHVVVPPDAIMRGVTRMNSRTSAAQLGRGAKNPIVNKSLRESACSTSLDLTFRGFGTVLERGLLHV